MNFIKAKGIISSLIFKFDLYRSNINRQELSQFSNLKILIFTDHILQLKKDMKSRFQDLLELQICNWILDPFSFEFVEDLEPHLQKEFIDLKHDCEAQLVFKHVYEFAWIKLKDTYPQLWQQVKLLLLFFPSTYLVEKGFSVVVQLLTKQRNRLDICNKLVATHQAQDSH
ncbi:protein FAM200A-like [Daktulosphaira vitifoliae]|uniref:protein FAM200A-like n=1 Tax=Daktulosphaira vitifoliae TaxID=58002 RepID=UPI0021AAA24D|nr:protein FAM200A-like [Daktulosphaira vitifoliae]